MKNKLLDILPNGMPVVRQVALTLLEARVGDVIVVTGHQSQLVEEALHGLGLRCVYSPEHANGMGASLAAGVRATVCEVAGFLVCPGDLPWLQVSTVSQVRETFFRLGRGCHVVPVQDGIRGHPVVLGSWLRPGLERLSGEAGARVLLGAPGESERCHELCVSDSGIHRDVDAGLSRGEFRNP